MNERATAVSGSPEVDEVTERLAEQVLDLVRRAGPGGAEAEVTAQTQTVALTRFANSFIHQNVSDTTVTVQLRVHVDGRTASGATTVTSADGLAGLVERTLAASRLLPVDLGWPGLAPPTEEGVAHGSADPAGPLGAGNSRPHLRPHNGHWDPAVADADPTARASLVRAFVDAAGGLSTAGYCRTTRAVGCFGNTAGRRVMGGVASVAMDGIARTASSDGVARAAGARLSDVDGAALGAVAATKARAAVDAVDLEPGRYQVLLEPCAVSDLVTSLGVWGYNGKAVAEGRSFVELGAVQMDPSVVLVDDPFRPGSADLPFDAEGSSRSRVELVREGVSVAVAHDRRTAKESDAQSTGHAKPPGFRIGPFASGLRLEPAAAPTAPTAGRPVADESVAGLLSGVKRGLLVSDLWYTRVLDPRTLVVTGLTRNGVWLIENGDIVRPVTNLRFTQSYPDALGPGQVRGIGAHAVTIPYHWGLLGVTAPALHLGSWNFTGGAAG